MYIKITIQMYRLSSMPYTGGGISPIDVLITVSYLTDYKFETHFDYLILVLL